MTWSDFEIDDWAKIDVTKQRCEFKTNKLPYFDIIKDLVNDTFGILKETPIKSLGINHIYTLNLQNKKRYFEFGNTFSPLSLWSDSFNDPKLMQLEIIDEKRNDGNLGSFRVRITPSQKNDFNITVNINDHFMIDQGKTGTGGEMTTLLMKNYKPSRERSITLLENMLKKIN